MSISIIQAFSAEKTLNIVPKPQHIIIKEGSFPINEQTSIFISEPELKKEADFLSEGIKINTNLSVSFKPQQQNKNQISLILSTDIEGNEEYIIQSQKEKIEIKAKTKTGIFYGIQTLLQMATEVENGNYIIPLADIHDNPRFAWRGMHLDVCRHFYPIEFIKKMIDMLSMHKMNIFHWHLTEDQGWRIEIKKYPLLTEIGAWRNSTKIGHMAEYPHQFDGEKYGGFYTQEQIKEVVNYAMQRHVTIVPEIELPGHAQAAIASYPYLGCFEQDVEVWNLWGVSNNVFCAGKESTFEFLEDVMDEVIALFPGKYIHVGGDECPKEHWKECELCQKRIQEEGLKDEHELQSYFIQRVERYLSSKGKKLIGWDEILEGGLAEGAAVMSWRGEKGGIAAAELGHEVVMSPTGWCYFDFYQSNEPNEPVAIAGLTTLEKVYNYDPIPEKLAEDKTRFILGTQANLWTEYIKTEDHLEYMIFPRLCALSEVQWTNVENKRYDDFQTRMDKHYIRLSEKGINYRIPTPEGLAPIQIYNDKEVVIQLKNTVPSSKIRYTLDGSEPTENSEVYKKPIEISLEDDVEIKAATFLSNGLKSSTVSSVLKKRKLKGYQIPRKTPGLSLEFYDGPFSSFKEISDEPKLSQKVNWLVIPHNTIQQQKGWIFKGYMQIDYPGTYTFELSSDCGSGFYIDDELVIDHDGFFYTKGKQCTVQLKKGFYPITVNYFNSVYGSFVRLYYKRPGGKKMEVFPGGNYFRE